MCPDARGRARSLASLLLSMAAAPSSTELAIANGDTRTILLTNQHTNESGAFTYMVNGSYDPAVLEKLNWFLRDWRLNEPTQMDPKLFDILWEVYRESGSQQPIDVLSGYRSPQTNAMLRRRSRQVAEHSQHMEGQGDRRAFHRCRHGDDPRHRDAHAGRRRRLLSHRHDALGAYRQRRGALLAAHEPRRVGRLFPDGKTVFIPADGQPMPGYELARAEIEARGGEVITASNQNSGGLFGWLFGGPRGGGADDAEEGSDSNAPAGRGKVVVASAQAVSPGSDPLAAAKRNLPSGETYAQAGSDALATASISGSVRYANRVDTAAKISTAPPQPTAAVAPAAAPQTQAIVAQNANSPADTSVVSLHGPIADRFLAPLPPRKPTELIEAALVDAPLPPQRPSEFAVAAAEAKPVDIQPAEPKPAKAPSANRDLIAALLERGRLPGVITRGLSRTPKDALALTETVEAPEPPERPEVLARAAALVAPLPPARPLVKPIAAELPGCRLP